MLESTFLEDWDEIGTKMAKKGHLLPKSGINSELLGIQRVKMFFEETAYYNFKSVLNRCQKLICLAFIYRS